MSEKLNFDFTDYCRTCAIETKHLKSLYQLNEHGKTLADKIKECTSVSFHEYEFRPKFICINCVLKLNTAYEFYQLVQKSDEKFMELLESEFIKKSETNTADDELNDLRPLILVNTQTEHFEIESIIDELNPKHEDIYVDESNVTQFHAESDPHIDDASSDVALRRHRNRQKRRKSHKKPAPIKRRRISYVKNRLIATEFQCYDCKEMCSNEGKLRVHFRELHDTTTECRICIKRFTRHEYDRHLCDGTEMKCQYCTKPFNSTVMLVKHINRQHKNHHNYKCYDCARAFPTKVLLEIHKPTHNMEEMRFSCDICGNRYRTRYQIKEHIETTHTDKRSFLCATCGKSFNNVTNWRLHVSRHTPTKPVACPKCPKRFFDKHGLKKHIEVHDEQKFECGICGSVMRSKASYGEHMRRHKKTKIFTCEVCSKQIKTSIYNLKLHMMTHTGEKPFKCTYCDRRYTQSADLNKHLRTHVGQNTYKCNHCELSFRLLRELRKHISEHYLQNLANIKIDTRNTS